MMHKYRHSCMCYVQFANSSGLMRAAGEPQTLNSRKKETFCSLSTPYPEVFPTWDVKLGQLYPAVKALWVSIAILCYWQLPQVHLFKIRRKLWCAWQPDEGVMYSAGGFRKTGHHDLMAYAGHSEESSSGKDAGLLFFEKVLVIFY